MKKVGIMTWWHYCNLGTVLQVTATSRTVNKLGYEANVIKYFPHGKVITLNKDYKSLNRYIKKLEKKINRRKIKQFKDIDREKAFEKYLNKHITLTKLCETDSHLYDLNNYIDAFICGSDQIWAPSCFNSKYFLDFVEDTNKMIAYAPSIGLFKIEDHYVRERMKECISRFKHLGIREEQGQKLIKDLCNKEAKVVLDPTLLLGQEEWNEIASKEIKDSNYILCYFLGNNTKSWNHIRLLSKKTGLKVKVIPVFEEDLTRGFEIEKGVGPEEFLGLVKNASFICTDSFHGTVFSLIYEKPFYTYERFSNKDSNSQNSRIYNILKIAELENRIVKDKSNISEDLLKCDFTKARKNIEQSKKASMNYLENALQESTNVQQVKEYKITNTCCGCGVCSTVCKKNAIDIQRNIKGFLEANINQDKCVQCGKCKKVCPYTGEKGSKIDEKEHKLFMAVSKDNSVLNTSSSGGIGCEISRLLCNDGYDVIGCVYDKEKQEAAHKRILAGEMDKLHIFQGSKYIQSNSVEAITEVMNESKKAVIFGTPCQIAGVDKGLKLKGIRDNFILVDLICHGVPSQKLWDKYIREGVSKYGYELNASVDFRDKRKGWREKYIRIEGTEKSYSKDDKKDLFYRFFEIAHCYADVCYECNYRVTSQSDIRIGDYWGPRYKSDKKGVSMVIAMTTRGEDILGKLNQSNKIELQQMDCKEYWEVQYPQNPIKPVFHNKLIEDLGNETMTLEEIANKYCKEYEWNRKVSKSVRIIKDAYRKVRKN